MSLCYGLSEEKISVSALVIESAKWKTLLSAQKSLSIEL